MEMASLILGAIGAVTGILAVATVFVSIGIYREKVARNEADVQRLFGLIDSLNKKFDRRLEADLDLYQRRDQ